MSPPKKEIHITTGDVDGIGLEVTLKALNLIRLPSDLTVFVYTHKKRLPSLKKKNVNFILREDEPVEWVIEVSKKAMKHPKKMALVTGPLSKEGIRRAGYPYIGHTEILKKISRRKNLFQTYLGSKANVLLVTDHISIDQVNKKLSQTKIIVEALKQALRIKQQLKLRGKVALLGLDPHAGEGGIIGTHDQKVEKQLKLHKVLSSEIVGPIPADSAFQSGLRKNIGLYVALYHDQGLIPFKTLHGFSEGVHLTAGLPFVRTSVDHGTAKTLFKKGKADPGSMKAAINTAINLIGKPL